MNLSTDWLSDVYWPAEPQRLQTSFESLMRIEGSIRPDNPRYNRLRSILRGCDPIFGKKSKKKTGAKKSGLTSIVNGKIMVYCLIFLISYMLICENLKFFCQYISICYTTRTWMYDLKWGKMQRMKGKNDIFRCHLKLLVSKMYDSLPTGYDTIYNASIE